MHVLLLFMTSEAAPAMDEATSLQQQGFLDVVKKQVSAMNLEQKRGACRKCGNVGHLTYQCRNFVDQSLNEKASDASSSDSSDDEAPAMPAGDLKPTADGKRSVSSDDDSEPKRGRKRDRSRSRDREERSRSRSGERKKSKKHKKSKDKKKVREFLGSIRLEKDWSVCDKG